MLTEKKKPNRINGGNMPYPIRRLFSDKILVESLFTALLETLLELVNSSACVNKLLLSCKERMALGANVNAKLAALALCGMCSYGFAACATNRYFFILRMDSCLHCFHLINLLKILMHRALYHTCFQKSIVFFLFFSIY